MLMEKRGMEARIAKLSATVSEKNVKKDTVGIDEQVQF